MGNTPSTPPPVKQATPAYFQTRSEHSSTTARRERPARPCYDWPARDGTIVAPCCSTTRPSTPGCGSIQCPARPGDFQGLLLAVGTARKADLCLSFALRWNIVDLDRESGSTAAQVHDGTLDSAVRIVACFQGELDAAGTTVPINLVGVGQAGTGSNNDGITDGRDIPWLQDDNTADAWGEWGAGKYEFMIVDASGEVVALYNLGQSNLVNSSNYDMVKQHLIDLANAN